MAGSSQAFALRALLHKNIAALEAMLAESCESLPIEHADRFYHLANLHVDVSVNETDLLDREVLFGVMKAQVFSAMNNIEEAPKLIQSSRLVAKANLANDTLEQQHNAAAQNNSQSKQDEPSSVLCDSIIDSLLYYLGNGILPWYAMPNEPLTEAVRQLRAKPSLVMLINQQVTDFCARQRWIAFLLSSLNAPYKVLGGLLNPSLFSKVKSNLSMCERVLASSLNMQSKLNIITLFTSLSYARLPYGLTDQLTSHITAQIQAMEDDATSLPFARSLLAIIESIKDQIKDYSKDTLEIEQTAKIPQQHELPICENPDKALFDKNAGSMRLDHAGLVLFHPYLLRLFTRQQWLNAERQIKPDCLNIAARSLCYLCAGTTTLAEHQAGMIKILLGVNVKDLLLVTQQPLSNELIEELENLTTSFITHWGSLGNTSTEVLRTIFVGRNGILTFTDSSWRLTIERQALDVLLDSLPFSLSTIKLPWMHFPLHVTW